MRGGESIPGTHSLGVLPPPPSSRSYTWTNEGSESHQWAGTGGVLYTGAAPTGLTGLRTEFFSPACPVGPRTWYATILTGPWSLDFLDLQEQLFTEHICTLTSLSGLWIQHCKKGYRFHVTSRDVTNQTPPGRELLNSSQPGRIWSVTSRPGTGKTTTFFYSEQVQYSDRHSGPDRCSTCIYWCLSSDRPGRC
jgi:hypothetical protein